MRAIGMWNFSPPWALTPNTGRHRTNKVNLYNLWTQEHLYNLFNNFNIYHFYYHQGKLLKFSPGMGIRVLQGQAAAVAMIHGRVKGSFSHLRTLQADCNFVGFSMDVFLNFSQHLSNIWWENSNIYSQRSRNGGCLDQSNEVLLETTKKQCFLSKILFQTKVCIRNLSWASKNHWGAWGCSSSWKRRCMCFIPPLVKRPWLFPKKSQLHIVAGEIYIFFSGPSFKTCSLWKWFI